MLESFLPPPIQTTLSPQPNPTNINHTLRRQHDKMELGYCRHGGCYYEYKEDDDANMTTIFNCKETGCNSDSRWYCSEHIKKCLSCNNWYCCTHVTKCTTCNNHYCESHISKCTSCSQYHCHADIVSHKFSCFGTSPMVHLQQLQGWLSNIEQDIKKWEKRKADREDRLRATLEKQKLEFDQSLQLERENLQKEFESKIKQFKDDQEQFEKEKQAFEREKATMAELHQQQKGVVKLNIGGSRFETSISTLTKYPSMFQAMFSGRYENEKDSEGAYFIDRDGTNFRHILNFMRNGKVSKTLQHAELEPLQQEAEFYGIEELIQLLEQKIKE